MQKWQQRNMTTSKLKNHQFDFDPDTGVFSISEKNHEGVWDLYESLLTPTVRSNYEGVWVKRIEMRYVQTFSFVLFVDRMKRKFFKMGFRPRKKGVRNR